MAGAPVGAALAAAMPLHAAPPAMPLPTAPTVSISLPTPGAGVTVIVLGLRSARGQVLACLTARANTFPDCTKDPLARKLKVPAIKDRMQIDFGAVPPGRYAVSLIHDENGNGKLDTAMMIPREGYGFSLDAPVRMGPPKFDRAAFVVDGGDVHLTIRMRYLL